MYLAFVVLFFLSFFYYYLFVCVCADSRTFFKKYMKAIGDPSLKLQEYGEKHALASMLILCMRFDGF